jgi:hypothetical protein
MFQKIFNDIKNSSKFLPLQSFSKDSGVHRNSNSQSGRSFKSVGVHSLMFSYIPRNMKCNSWGSLLARTFVSLCLGHEPKARVVTLWFLIILQNHQTFIPNFSFKHGETLLQHMVY